MQPQPDACYGLLLAAGFGKRFGADKRLQPLPGGAGVAQTTVENWLAACEADSAPEPGTSRLDHIYVVTRPADALASSLTRWLATLGSAPLSVLHAPNAALGMGHTLASAVAQIPPGALVIGLADMPWVRPATLIALAAELTGADDPQVIVQPRHEGTPGNPLGFGAGQRAALASATGDKGARELVKAARRRGHLRYLETTDPGVLLDIDTPADLAAAPPR